jgi:cytochrome c biogenesis protein CcmG/thiol:disulfide interchange protein DsbE
VQVLSLDRRTASLAELTRGRPALVALWATWCTACAHELGELDRLQAKLGGDALVVGVAVGEPYDKVAEFLRARPVAYAQLVDEEFKLSEALGERRVPATLVVDRSGAVRYSGGALDAKALAALRSAIAE